MNIYLAWCIVCLALVNRLWCQHEHGMAWCDVVLFICVTKHYVDMKIMSIRLKAYEGNLPVSALSWLNECASRRLAAAGGWAV